MIWDKPSEPITRNDIARMYRTFGVRLSCSIADQINMILRALGCDFMVECCNEDAPNEIGPGVNLDPLFQ